MATDCERRDATTHAASLAGIEAALASHPVHRIAPVGAPYLFGRFHRDRLTYKGLNTEFRKSARAVLTAAQGKPASQRRFLIFARPRSGTTLLVDLLRQVRDMHCDGEVLHYGVLRPTRHVKNLAAVRTKTAYGCKVLSYQLLEVQRMKSPLSFFDSLAADGFHFVHLRRDTFAQCLSLATAMQTSVFAVRDGKARKEIPGEVVIDEDRFRAILKWNAAMLDYEDTLMSAYPHLRLQYEDDLTDPVVQQAAVDRICTLIGHPTSPVSARLERVGGTMGRIRVSNRDALLRIAQETLERPREATAPGTH
jgi:LPS sulfotransferase NodH